jgi:hypothetical protein
MANLNGLDVHNFKKAIRTPAHENDCLLVRVWEGTNSLQLRMKVFQDIAPLEETPLTSAFSPRLAQARCGRRSAGISGTWKLYGSESVSVVECTISEFAWDRGCQAMFV